MTKLPLNATMEFCRKADKANAHHMSAFRLRSEPDRLRATVAESLLGLAALGVVGGDSLVYVSCTGEPEPI